MKKTVVTDVYMHQDALDLLGSKCRVICLEQDEHKVRIARDNNAAGAVLTAGWRFNGKVMDQLDDLLVIARPGTGVDNVDIRAATERGITVVNTPDGPTVSTAEHAVALMMALAKRHKPAIRLLATGQPFIEEPMLIELNGRVLGIVGLGRIGGAVAHICGVGLGMKVIAYDPFLTDDRPAKELGVTLYPNLRDLLQVADFVSLHCKPTPEARSMINAETLSLMKPTAFLVNTARGMMVDEHALLAALQAGTIAGAAMDVFAEEPPPANHPLHSLENVVATPHTAGFTEACQRKMGMGIAEEVLDVLAGRRPANMLNPDVWDSPIRRRA